MYDQISTDETGNRIASFSFKNMQLRIVVKDGEPWFAAHDVAVALEYQEAHKLTRLLKEDEKGLHKVDTLGGEQQLLLINEKGLYRAIFNSRKPEALAFQDWVFGEVLPAIRKQGFYGQAPAMDAPPAIDDQGLVGLYLPPEAEDYLVHPSGVMATNETRLKQEMRRAVLFGAEQDLLDIQRNRKAIPLFTGLMPLPSWIRLNHRHAMFAHSIEFGGGDVISPWIWCDPFTADSIMFVRDGHSSNDIGFLVREHGYSIHTLIRKP